MNATHYDVVVVGGGTAGTVAAIQAGRAGARCLLLERTGMLGGTTTSAGVSFPGLFHAWGRQIIAGIGWELVKACVQEGGGTLPDLSQQPSWHGAHQVRINPSLYAALCDEAVANANVEPLFHSMLAACSPATDGWRLMVCTKIGLTDITARVLIDCTGDANAVSLAGYPLRIPDEVQPATLMCRVSGYSMDDLDIEALNRAYDEQVRRGLLSYTDIGWNSDRADLGRWLRVFGENAGHVGGINARNSEGRTRLETASRLALLRVFRFLRGQSGLENLRIDFLASECGVRESATIVGRETVTLEDYVSGRVWEDAVCFSFYPIDLHTVTGSGLDCRPLPEGVVATVPRGAMLPDGSRNLIAAGRCISSDRLANSALRVQATCMATGQAAGAMGALACRTGMDVEHLDIREIRGMLRENGAVVPD